MQALVPQLQLTPNVLLHACMSQVHTTPNALMRTCMCELNTVTDAVMQTLMCLQMDIEVLYSSCTKRYSSHKVLPYVVCCLPSG